MSIPRRMYLPTILLLVIGGWVSHSAAFSTRDGYRLKKDPSFRQIDRQTPLNLFQPSTPLRPIPRYPSKEKHSTTCMAARARTLPMAHIAVNLDSPVLAPRRDSSLLKYFMGGLGPQLLRTALITFAIALVIAIVTRLSSAVFRKFNPLQSLSYGYRVTRGCILRVIDKFRNENIGGTPMQFSEEVDEGWGVCTLASKEVVGRSQFVKYVFDLPREDNTLDLLSGQQVTLCYLNKEDIITKGDYYLYSPKNSKGSFSILVPKIQRIYSTATDGDEVIQDFSELSIGDEIALKPGSETFQYHGKYVPVTDLLHFVAGEGIAPVINQVKTVLPSKSSSLKLIKVVWVNESEKDFDVGQSTLEEDYYKYFKKLAVSCIVGDFERSELWDNEEIVANIPRFNPGTMVVTSGPQSFVAKARDFLIETGYPDECICAFQTD